MNPKKEWREHVTEQKQVQEAIKSNKILDIKNKALQRSLLNKEKTIQSQIELLDEYRQEIYYLKEQIILLRNKHLIMK